MVKKVTGKLVNRKTDTGNSCFIISDLCGTNGDLYFTYW